MAQHQELEETTLLALAIPPKVCAPCGGCATIRADISLQGTFAHRNPIGRLPAEVLCEIFVLALRDTTDRLEMILSLDPRAIPRAQNLPVHVCCEIALGESRLWTVVVLHHPNPNRRHALDRIARAKSRPLQLVYDSRCYHKYEYPIGDKLSSCKGDSYTLMQMLALLSRANLLLFSPDVCFVRSMGPCFWMPHRRPRGLLQRLVLNVSKGVRSHQSLTKLFNILVSLPIKELCLPDGPLCIDCNPIGKMPNLRKLEVYAQIEADVLLGLYLKRAQNLEVVELYKYSGAHISLNEWDDSRLKLPNLGTLKVNYWHREEYDARSLLSNLTLPALKHLELGRRSQMTMTWPTEEDMEFFGRSQCSLHTLALPRFIVSPLLSNLIACQPTIHSLEVDMCEQDLQMGQADRERSVAELMRGLRDPEQLKKLERLVIRVRPEHIDDLAEVLNMRHTGTAMLKECDVLVEEGDCATGEIDVSLLNSHRDGITLQRRTLNAAHNAAPIQQ